MRIVYRHFYEAENCLMMRIKKRIQTIILPINRQCVLG